MKNSFKTNLKTTFLNSKQKIEKEKEIDESKEPNNVWLSTL